MWWSSAPATRAGPSSARWCWPSSEGAGAPGGLRLEGWTAIDAQNKRTTVRLSNQRYNVAVPDSAFTYAEPKRKKA